MHCLSRRSSAKRCRNELYWWSLALTSCIYKWNNAGWHTLLQPSNRAVNFWGFLKPQRVKVRPASVLSTHSLVLNPQSLVLNPQSSFLSPESSFPNPQSSNLNPQSQIRNPQSSIINPWSSVLNPHSSETEVSNWLEKLTWYFIFVSVILKAAFFCLKNDLRHF